MEFMSLQKQIRDNAGDLQSFQTSLQDWEKEMKENDDQLLKLYQEQMTVSSPSEVIKKGEERKHKEADEHKLRGNNFVKDEKWKEAIEEYTDAIAIYSNDGIYYGNRAYCYLQLNDLKKAEEDCSEALKLKPDYAKVYLRRAHVRKKNDNIYGAAMDFNTVLILEPQNENALKEYAELYPKLKSHYKKLGVNLPEFIEMNPSFKTLQDDEIKSVKMVNVENDKKNLKRNASNNKASKESKSVRKKSSDTLPMQDNRQQENLSEKSIKKKYKNDDFAIITVTKNKPPHLRSTVPLKRVKIEDEYISTDENY